MTGFKQIFQTKLSEPSIAVKRAPKNRAAARLIGTNRLPRHHRRACQDATHRLDAPPQDAPFGQTANLGGHRPLHPQARAAEMAILDRSSMRYLSRIAPGWT